MSDNNKNKIKLLVFWAAFTAGYSYAENGDCRDTSFVAKDRLQWVYEGVQKSHTREQYQNAIRKRYDKVEELLGVVSSCIKKEKREDLDDIKSVLLMLRAHARTLAFTKFVNWRQVKDQEILILEDSRLVKKVVYPDKKIPASANKISH